LERIFATAASVFAFELRASPDKPPLKNNNIYDFYGNIFPTTKTWYGKQ